METATVTELHRPAGSNVPAMLVNLVALVAAAVSLGAAWPTTHPAWTVAVILWLAYFQHTWTMIFHEDAHYTLYRARWHNILNGIIIGTLIFIPFNVYRQVHIRHHARMNGPADWECWPYCDPATSLRFRRIFVLFDILCGLALAPYVYGRIFFVRKSPLTEPRLRRQILLEYGIIIVFWTILLAVVVHYQAWWLFAKVYVIPAWIAGVFQTIRKLTEHLGLPAGNPMAGARTVLHRTLVGRLFSYTHFHVDAHGLHHQYPQMPHPNLEKVYQQRDADAAARVFTNYWQAMRDMLPHLVRPGIGVNVAGPAAHPDPQ